MLTHTVLETGVKPFLFNEVLNHLKMALPDCTMKTVMSTVVQVKLAVSKFGHEVLDNLQVAANGSKVEGIPKVLYNQST